MDKTVKIYLDNAATTPIASEVIEVMTAVTTRHFGNPSSTHSVGRDARAVVESARRSIAKYIHAEPKSILFTSGGTEANNSAIQCAVRDLGVKRIITSPIEHHAVLHAVEQLKGIPVDYVRLSPTGQVDADHLETLLAATTDKTLVSLMHANNEIGTLLDIQATSKLCKQYRAYFQSDTVQTMGHYPINSRELEVDFMTCSAHKFHGPKGVGFMYIHPKHVISPWMQGGSQERGLRGGTENVVGIAGLAKALELAHQEMEKRTAHIQRLKTTMITALKQRIPGVGFNGEIDPKNSLYTVLNVHFPAFERQSMLLFLLDLEGIACSGGSACTSGSALGSHVLKGIRSDMSRSSIRFSLSHYTTAAEIEATLDAVEKIVTS